MIDLFIGKSPTTDSNKHASPSPIQKVVRELLRISRTLKLDKRKNTAERRKNQNPDIVVDLSQKSKMRRTRLDRRQKLESIVSKITGNERRTKRLDRRRSVNDGVIVKLSTKNDQRSSFDRRRS